ncbi:MAG: histidine kinase, partial [Phycisphaerales bacterium]
MFKFSPEGRGRIMQPVKHGGGWRAILYTLRKAHQAGGFFRMWKALRTRNTCKTCALGMGGELGGMVNEKRHFPEVCKKSVQAMAADLQGAIHEHFFADFNLAQLRGFSSRELEAAGRLTRPVMAGPLDQNYREIDWDDAIDRIVAQLKRTSPDEAMFYFSGRSSNEAAFMFQLFARLYGTNHVNNCSFFCHQASGVGLSTVTGSSAGTVALDDIDHADLLFVIGANPASNHPRLLRTMVELRRRGGRIIVINPVREPGLVKFKVPSDWRSMLKASTIADEYIQPHVGGDCALLAGLLKAVVESDERGALDTSFIENHSEGWEACRASIEAMSWEDITHRSGIDRAEIERIAKQYLQSRNTIFAWAMGITHHEFGVENVRMIANLAMARGMLGRRGAGLLPLRGHSNVQGVGSMGVVPNLKPAIRQKMESAFNVKLPVGEGDDTLQSLERAQAGGLRFMSCMGGNLYGSSPDANFAAEAFAKTDFVVYFNTTLNTSHTWGRGRETLILPVLARDEEPQTTTQESMFSYVRFSEGGEARHEGPRSEVDLVLEIARRYFGDDSPVDWAAFADRTKIREKIAAVIPGYAPMAKGVNGSADAKDRTREFYVEGRRFDRPSFATESGRAKFHAIDLPPLVGDDGGERTLRLMTLRSEGQFNTVVYEEEDVYRGQDRRDVILMHSDDIARLGLQE